MLAERNQIRSIYQKVITSDQLSESIHIRSVYRKRIKLDQASGK